MPIRPRTSQQKRIDPVLPSSRHSPTDIDDERVARIAAGSDIRQTLLAMLVSAQSQRMAKIDVDKGMMIVCVGKLLKIVINHLKVDGGDLDVQQIQAASAEDGLLHPAAEFFIRSDGQGIRKCTINKFQAALDHFWFKLDRRYSAGKFDVSKDDRSGGFQSVERVRLHTKQTNVFNDQIVYIRQDAGCNSQLFGTAH